MEHLGACGARALIVTGSIGAGKTTAALQFAELWRASNRTVGGVASPRVLDQGETVGYKVRDLRSGQEMQFCSAQPPGIPFRRFFFSPQGLAFANEVLTRDAQGLDVVVIDEVGPLELAGGGLCPGVHQVLSGRSPLLVTVRPSLLRDFHIWAGLTGKTVVVSLDRPEETGA